MKSIVKILAVATVVLVLVFILIRIQEPVLEIDLSEVEKVGLSRIVDISADEITAVSIVGMRAEFTLQQIGDKFHFVGDPDESKFDQDAARLFVEAIAGLIPIGIVSPKISDEDAGIGGYNLIVVTTTDHLAYEFRVGSQPMTNQIRAVRVIVRNSPAPEPSRIQAHIQADQNFSAPDDPAQVDSSRKKFREETYEEKLRQHGEDERARMAIAERLTEEFADKRYVISGDSYDAILPTRQDLMR